VFLLHCPRSNSKFADSLALPCLIAINEVIISRDLRCARGVFSDVTSKFLGTSSLPKAVKSWLECYVFAKPREEVSLSLFSLPVFGLSSSSPHESAGVAMNAMAPDGIVCSKRFEDRR
jgi:hypothetical protein